MGLKVDRGGLQYEKVFAATRKAADTLSRGVEFLLKKNKVALVKGRARLAGPHELAVEGPGAPAKLGAKFILVATGSRPRAIPGFDFDERTVLSSTGLLMMKDLPKRMVILGSGYIGMEFAHAMNAFGVEVRVVEMLKRILPNEDPEMAKVLVRAFRKRGLAMDASTKAVGLMRTGDGLEVTLEGPGGVKSSAAG